VIPPDQPADAPVQPPPESRPADHAFRGHRARDAALVLPLAGLVLVGPPVINLFTAELTVMGAPLIAVYLFGVWGLLIAGALWLSRRLREDDRP
jgi:hypothetical protein